MHLTLQYYNHHHQIFLRRNAYFNTHVMNNLSSREKVGEIFSCTSFIVGLNNHSCLQLCRSVVLRYTLHFLSEEVFPRLEIIQKVWLNFFPFYKITLWWCSLHCPKQFLRIQIRRIGLTRLHFFLSEYIGRRMWQKVTI